MRRQLALSVSNVLQNLQVIVWGDSKAAHQEQ